MSLFFVNLFCLVLGYDTQDVGIITANVSDEDSLNAMCSKAQIILNCVGPVSWILVMENNYYCYINDYVLLSLISSVIKDMQLVCLFVHMYQRIMTIHVSFGSLNVMLYMCYTSISTLVQVTTLGPHKDRGKLWPGWDLNAWPPDCIRLSARVGSNSTLFRVFLCCCVGCNIN